MNLKKAREAIRENLKDCCRDIQTWHNTGILPSGKAHQIATEFCDCDPRLMEAEVDRAAREFVIASPDGITKMQILSDAGWKPVAFRS